MDSVFAHTRIGTPLSTDRRYGFRVPLAELPEILQRAISVEITRGSESIPATMIDLSLTGILVTDLQCALKVGDTVQVTIDAADVLTTLAGSVVRTVEDSAVGINFPQSYIDGEFDPPVRLSRIHRAMEQAWLKSRKESKR